jgi:hypothetical protein
LGGNMAVNEAIEYVKFFRRRWVFLKEATEFAILKIKQHHQS